MLCGGFLMTYSISVVGSIISGMDAKNQVFEEKMQILNRIQSDYSIPLDLFLALR